VDEPIVEKLLIGSVRRVVLPKFHQSFADWLLAILDCVPDQSCTDRPAGSPAQTYNVKSFLDVGFEQCLQNAGGKCSLTTAALASDRYLRLHAGPPNGGELPLATSKARQE
jgi:hypothetical protein